MKIRIIAGKLRNLQIKLLNNLVFRPSREKLREAFFSSLHFEIENKSFLDAFGGSGIFGFEAFSRGAKIVNIIEKKYALYKHIKFNAKKLKIDTQIDINNYDFIDYLKSLDELKYDYIFLDPPYDLYKTINDCLILIGNLNKNLSLKIFVETNNTKLIEVPECFVVNKIKKYGSSYLMELHNKNRVI